MYLIVLMYVNENFELVNIFFLFSMINIESFIIFIISHHYYFQPLLFSKIHYISEIFNLISVDRNSFMYNIKVFFFVKVW